MRIGLYVHIPFCKMKCHYCDFLSFPKNDQFEAYTNALCNELIAYGERIRGVHTISSIFIGGGTPTVLPPFLLEKIGQVINKSFVLEDDLEWSVEANPGTINKDHVEVFNKIGVNRVSIGLQACQSHLLHKLGRIHDLKAWEETVVLLQEYGISNINTDLMFSLPEQTLDDWKETLKIVVDKKVPHISAYALIIEEGTYFYELYEKNILNLPDEVLDRQMYHYAQAFLEEHGYRQYEISNWAKEDLICKHNELYWKQGSYIGAGLGSHGYLDDIRYHNTIDMQSYIEANGQIEELIVEKEPIDLKMAMEEFMFLGLRLREGITLDAFKEKFQKDMMEVYGPTIEKWIKEGALIQDNNTLKLSDFGLDISNQVYTSFLL